jgi:hypothetical protein
VTVFTLIVNSSCGLSQLIIKDIRKLARVIHILFIAF